MHIRAVQQQYTREQPLILVHSPTSAAAASSPSPSPGAAAGRVNPRHQHRRRFPATGPSTRIHRTQIPSNATYSWYGRVMLASYGVWRSQQCGQPLRNRSGVLSMYEELPMYVQQYTVYVNRAFAFCVFVDVRGRLLSLTLILRGFLSRKV